MLEEPVFVLCTLIALTVVIVKLVNVMKLGQFYGPEWILTSFVVHAVGFMFFLFMALHGIAENVELVSYLWGHILLFMISSILFIAEVLIFFIYLLPRNAGSERYGDRGRLLINRER